MFLLNDAQVRSWDRHLNLLAVEEEVQCYCFGVFKNNHNATINEVSERISKLILLNWHHFKATRFYPPLENIYDKSFYFLPNCKFLHELCRKDAALIETMLELELFPILENEEKKKLLKRVLEKTFYHPFFEKEVFSKIFEPIVCVSPKDNYPSINIKKIHSPFLIDLLCELMEERNYFKSQVNDKKIFIDEKYHSRINAFIENVCFIFDLPAEILQVIISKLDFSSKLKFGKTCRHICNNVFIYEKTNFDMFIKTKCSQNPSLAELFKLPIRAAEQIIENWSAYKNDLVCDDKNIYLKTGESLFLFKKNIEQISLLIEIETLSNQADNKKIKEFIAKFPLDFLLHLKHVLADVPTISSIKISFADQFTKYKLWLEMLIYFNGKFPHFPFCELIPEVILNINSSNARV